MLQIAIYLATVLAIVTFSTSFAHALEYPGKMRLDRDDYLRVQPIYYPGFTFAGIAEPLTVIACLGASLLTPSDDASFGLVVAALISSSLVHLAYWVLTHPVNGFWLKDQELGRGGAAFFGTGEGSAPRNVDYSWTTLRDHWERSHIVRALLAGISVLSLLRVLSI